jgi:hypothetical protein
VIPGGGRVAVRGFEELIHLSLPVDYSEFLEKGSSENFSKDFLVYVPEFREFHRHSFVEMFCITDVSPFPRGSVGAELGDPIVPEGMIAIGRDLASSGFLMSLDAEDFGAVFWANVEFGWPYYGEGLAVKDPAFIVADSFTLFLEWLRAGGGPRRTTSKI